METSIQKNVKNRLNLRSDISNAFILRKLCAKMMQYLIIGSTNMKNILVT